MTAESRSSLSNWQLFQLLCALVAGNRRPALARCLAAGKLEDLLTMATSRQVLPALASRLTPAELHRHHPGTQLPPATAARLQRSLLQNTQRNLQITAQAVKLARLLNGAGITPLYLKGTAQLLAPWQAEVGFRKQLDIDLLLPPDLLESAAAALVRDGYVFVLPPAPGSTVQKPLRDIAAARRLSRGHHHLLPMVKRGYATQVELHQHHLPRRFQRANPSAELFGAASLHHFQGARYLLPAVAHQLIHLVLGNFVHDGDCARHDVSPRAIHDYLTLLATAAPRLTGADIAMIRQRGGKALATFAAVVDELAGPVSHEPICEPADISRRLRLMQRRLDSPRTGRYLDRQARVRHLLESLWHSHYKLPAYLRRNLQALAGAR